MAIHNTGRVVTDVYIRRVRSLSFVLQDAEVAVSERDPSPEEKTGLQTIRNGCQNILSELESALNKYTELESQQTGIGRKAKRAWKRLSLEPEDIRNLRSRVKGNISLLNASLYDVQKTTLPNWYGAKKIKNNRRSSRG